MKRNLILALMCVTAVLALPACGARSVPIPLAPQATFAQPQPAPSAAVQSADTLQASAVQTLTPVPSVSVKPSATPQAGPLATLGTAVRITDGETRK